MAARAYVETGISIHQALRAVDKLVEKIEPERLSLLDAARLEKAAARIRERFAKESPFSGMPGNVALKQHGPYPCGPNCGICELEPQCPVCFTTTAYHDLGAHDAAGKPITNPNVDWQESITAVEARPRPARTQLPADWQQP